jgi:TetR/AcrR family transcriptional regulator, lmrAB and yxaGH operons repressor
LKGEETRAKFVDTAAQLFQSHGYHGVGLAQIIKESGAPKGSFYFHFKGGKEELALAAIEKSVHDVTALLSHAQSRSGEPGEFVDSIANALKQWLRRSDYSGGCPVAGLTIELGATSQPVAEACRQAYESWSRQTADALTEFGIDAKNAQAIAYAVIASFEGAVVMSRALRSLRPIDQTAAVLIIAI